MKKLVVLFALALFFQHGYCYAVPSVSQAIVDIQISIIDILKAAIFVIIGMGLQCVAIFYAWRILKHLRLLFKPPAPSG